MLRIFIGYDSREIVAFHVLAHSLMRRASQPLAIHPLYLPALRASGLYTRERGPTESTEFSMTRFLVPYLCNYEGCALFLDCDILCQVDVAQLFTYIDAAPHYACWVVKHDYTPRTSEKMDGCKQTSYPRKNWSSVMLFNNRWCRDLTPYYVNTASGLDLHRFHWTSDDLIRDLPLEWNWLVGEYPPNPSAAMLHYTLGGPWFQDYVNGPEADRWLAEYEQMQLRVTPLIGSPS